QFLEQPAERAPLRPYSVVVVAEQAQRGARQFQQAGSVAGALVVRLDLRVLARLEAGIVDFADLKSQEVELLRIGFLIDDQRGLFGFKRGAASDQCAEALAQRLQAPERIENRQLPLRVQERLVLVRPVNVDEPFADARERLQRRGGAVDELAVRACGSEHALEQELSVVTRFDAALVQEGGQRRPYFPHIEGGLDRAAVFAAAEERAVGALPQD